MLEKNTSLMGTANRRATNSAIIQPISENISPTSPRIMDTMVLMKMTLIARISKKLMLPIILTL